jgi:nicotinamidase-related amidase
MAIDADPYPWPYDGRLEGHRLALVVIGAQDRWTSVSVGTDAAHAALARLAQAVRSVGGRVVLVRHGLTDRSPLRGRSAARPHLGLPARHTRSWDLAVLVERDALVVDAGGFDGFFGSTLDHELRVDHRDLLLLGGFASEVLVDSTLRSANDRGYECLVVTDACAPIERATGERAHHSVTMSGGIFGALATAADVIAALSQSTPIEEIAS